LANNESPTLIHELAVETRKLFQNKEKEQHLTTNAMERVSSEQREMIREMYAEMANYLRKECKLTVPEIRKVLREMFSVSI